MTLKAVIFDMDGVLVDSNEAHIEAFKRFGSEVGATMTREFFFSAVGMHNSQIMPKWLGNNLTQKQIDDFGRRKEAIYREVAVGRLTPIPGALDLLKGVRALGLKTAVGSSGPRENVQLALKTLQIEGEFDAIVTGSDITHGKPNPEVFLKAAAKLGIDPAECVVIEDAPSGVKAALAAGMKVVAITTSKPAADLQGATRVVEQFSQLAPADLFSLG